MLQGLRTVIYHVTDLSRARDWYAEVLGAAPYFDEPFYVGFNVAGYELGLVPDEAAQPAGGTDAYWGVADAHAAHARLVSLGATSREDVHDVGGDILVGTVADPWGNTFGVIQNPHFKLGV